MHPLQLCYCVETIRVVLAGLGAKHLLFDVSGENIIVAVNSKSYRYRSRSSLATNV